MWVTFGFAIAVTRSWHSMKICPECGTPRMEPYDHNAKHELLYRCNKCGSKEFA